MLSTTSAAKSESVVKLENPPTARWRSSQRIIFVFDVLDDEVVEENKDEENGNRQFRSDCFLEELDKIVERSKEEEDSIFEDNCSTTEFTRECFPILEGPEIKIDLTGEFSWSREILKNFWAVIQSMTFLVLFLKKKTLFRK